MAKRLNLFRRGGSTADQALREILRQRIARAASELPRHLIPAGEGRLIGVSSLDLAGPSSEMTPAIPFGENR